MKRIAICSIFLLALAAFSYPALAADSGDSVSVGDFLIEAETLQSTDDGTSADAPLTFDEVSICSGGGGTCQCEGTCEADSSGCRCT